MKRITPLLLALLLAVAAPQAARAACTVDAECDDGNSCTTDTCDLVNGCIHAPTVECTPRIDLPVTGKKIKIRIPPGAPTEPGLRLLHTGGAIDLPTLPQPETPGDPTIAGGSLRLFSVAGGFDATYRLPATHWGYFPFFNPTGLRGYQYKDAFNLESPVGVVKIIGGKTVKMKAKGPLFVLSLASNPDPVHAVLSLGNRRYCMSFGGERFNYITNQIYWAKLAPAPSGCPCTIDPDCDDGDAGNGAETCVAGYCQ